MVKMGAGFAEKILVLGDCQLSDACIQKICKNHGLKKEVLKFIEYSKVKMFDFGALLDTELYSDIFVAASPHKAKNIEGSTSVCHFLEDYSERLPKSHDSTTGYWGFGVIQNKPGSGDSFFTIVGKSA